MVIVAKSELRSPLWIRAITPEPAHFLLQNVESRLASFRCGTNHRIFTPRVFNPMVQRRKLTNRIGSTGVARQQKSLAAASAKIYFTAVAGAAGLRHPVFAAKLLKSLGALPDPIERVFAHVVEAHTRNHARGMTRHRAAGGIAQHQLPSPPAHAGVWESGVVVGDDEVDAARPPPTLPRPR